MAKRRTSKTQISNRYDAAGHGRRMAGWTTPATGPNTSITGQTVIRDRARDSVRNEWSGESAIQKQTTNLVGIGIRPRLKRISGTRKQELNDLWEYDFVPNSDADGVLNFYGQQTLAVRSWLEAGEIFIRRRMRTPKFGLDVPMQVQLIESDFVPMLDTDNYLGLPTGNTIRSGIERDKRGQRTAYWMYKEHPGDRATGIINPSYLIRIPASEVIHMYMPSRPGALRGVSTLASIITKLKDRGNYEDAVRLRQQIANLFAVFFTRTANPNDGSPVADILPSGDSPLIGLQPGITMELDEGQDVKFANPPEAGTMYSDYIRTELMGESAAQGIPYEIFSGDIRNVSDRTLRVAINEFRRFCEQRQWQVIIPQMCQGVRDWWVDAAVLAGLVGMREADNVKRVEWAPHGWEYIHPVQDAEGKKLEVEAGFRSRASVVGERGDDIEETDAEIAADDKRQQTLKIGPYSKAEQQINNPPPPPAPAPAPAAPEPSPAPAPKNLTKPADKVAAMAADLAFADAVLNHDDHQLSLFEQRELDLQERTLSALGIGVEQ